MRGKLTSYMFNTLQHVLSVRRRNRLGVVEQLGTRAWKGELEVYELENPSAQPSHDQFGSFVEKNL